MKNDEKRFIPLETEDETKERPISKAYRVIDTDLARDNMENDMPAAELEDL